MEYQFWEIRLFLIIIFKLGQHLDTLHIVLVAIQIYFVITLEIRVLRGHEMGEQVGKKEDWFYFEVLKTGRLLCLLVTQKYNTYTLMICSPYLLHSGTAKRLIKKLGKLKVI